VVLIKELILIFIERTDPPLSRHPAVAKAGIVLPATFCAKPMKHKDTKSTKALRRASRRNAG
jgi:hypothetical protein